MKYLFLTALFFTIPTACAENVNDTTMATPTCETYVEWTGKNINDIDLSVLGDRQYRVLKPDSIMTMDFIPDRLNINVTDDGIVVTQVCG